MMIVDTSLKKRLAEGNPVRVAMVGAGYMGRGIALQILTAMPGLRLVAIANRDVRQAERACHEAGASAFRAVATPAGSRARWPARRCHRRSDRGRHRRRRGRDWTTGDAEPGVRLAEGSERRARC
jgi:hypothetical protein